jgi:hypothetical protein
MADQPLSSEQELARQVMPTILELQKVLVDRLAGTSGKGRTGELAIVSLTSCDSHSCH